MRVQILYHGDEAVGSWGVTPSYNLSTAYEPMIQPLYTLYTLWWGDTSMQLGAYEKIDQEKEI